MNLLHALIKLAREIPETRQHLIPIIQKNAYWKSPTEEGAKREFEKYKDQHPKTKKNFRDFLDTSLKSEKSQKKETETSQREKKPKIPLIEHLIKPEEKRLPENAVQPASSWEELYPAAQEAHNHQLDWLNHGRGIDRALKAEVIRADKGARTDLNRKGPLIIIAPLKGERRAREKIETGYKGDWSLMTDMVRASIGVDKVKELPKVLDTLRKSGMKLASKPRDRFTAPTLAGYRDLILQVAYPNGHIGELQINLKSMLIAKEQGHDLYEKTRSIESEAKRRGRTTLTEEESNALKEANSIMKEMYEEAWRKGGGEKMVSSGKTSSSRGTGYYNFNGFAAQWEYLKFPVKFLNGKKLTVYELYKFFHEAVPISEAEFHKLKEKHA